jgi:predicted DNA-binding transcriptional regulator AlpA
MTAHDTIAYPPRGLGREDAARYIGISPSTFDRLVAEGRMPRPTHIGKRVVWDRLKLDAAFADLDDSDQGNSIDRSLRMIPGGR